VMYALELGSTAACEMSWFHALSAGKTEQPPMDGPPVRKVMGAGRGVCDGGREGAAVLGGAVLACDGIADAVSLAWSDGRRSATTGGVEVRGTATLELAHAAMLNSATHSTTRPRMGGRTRFRCSMAASSAHPGLRL
jgi:hypothetical protein